MPSKSKSPSTIAENEGVPWAPIAPKPEPVAETRAASYAT